MNLYLQKAVNTPRQQLFTIMSQRNSVSAGSIRNSLIASANEPYDAIVAHYATEYPAEDSDMQSVEKKETLDHSRSTSIGHERSELRSRGIAETSPEPEESLDKQSRASNERFDEDILTDSCEARIRRLKKISNLFMVLTVALVVSLLGTLIGLIFLAVTRNHVHVDERDQNGSDLSPNMPIPVLRDTAILTMKFDEITNTDPAIASIFADHSLYQSFYGVNYNGSEISNCSAEGLQSQIAKDLALLSRITKRVRIVDNTCNLIDRVLNAIMDIKVNLAVVLNVNASEWAVKGPEIRRVLTSYPHILFDAVLIEQDDNLTSSYHAYSELESVFKHRDIKDISIRTIDPTDEQPNPLQFAHDPNTTRNWVLNDKARRVYTNLESPVETSEKARAMAVWVCGVADYLDPSVAWFWSTAFDTTSGPKQGIFTVDRKLKPAGLPRCADYV